MGHSMKPAKWLLFLTLVLCMHASNALAGPTDVTSFFSITKSGLLFNRTTSTYDTTVTLTNYTVTIEGPLSLIITNLPAGVTLKNASGTTQDGKPFLLLPTAGEQINPGEKIPNISLKFRNPARLNFVPSLMVQATWESVGSAQSGIALSYPDFGQELVGELYKNSPRNSVLDVRTEPDELSSGQSQYTVQFINNPTHQTIEQWFIANIDSSGLLLSGGTFTRAVLANGVIAYALRGPVANGYDGGPIPGIIYAITPSKQTIVVVSLSHDHKLGKSIVNADSIMTALLVMLETLSAP